MADEKKKSGKGFRLSYSIDKGKTVRAFGDHGPEVKTQPVFSVATSLPKMAAVCYYVGTFVVWGTIILATLGFVGGVSVLIYNLTHKPSQEAVETAKPENNDVPVEPVDKSQEKKKKRAEKQEQKKEESGDQKGENQDPPEDF